MALELLANASSFSSGFAAETVNEIANAKMDDCDRAFRCPVDECARIFTSKRNLVDHCRGHHQGTKPHVCPFPECGKSFLRPAHLLIHTRIHTGEKPFVCEFEGCGKRWNQKSALKQHMRSHTGEKPYFCTIKGCNKRFSTSSSCKRHISCHDTATSTAKRKRPSSPEASSGDEAPPSPSCSPPNTPVFIPMAMCMSPLSPSAILSMPMNGNDLLLPEKLFDTKRCSANWEPVKMTINYLLN